MASHYHYMNGSAGCLPDTSEVLVGGITAQIKVAGEWRIIKGRTTSEIFDRAEAACASTVVVAGERYV